MIRWHQEVSESKAIGKYWVGTIAYGVRVAEIYLPQKGHYDQRGPNLFLLTERWQDEIFPTADEAKEFAEERVQKWIKKTYKRMKRQK